MNLRTFARLIVISLVVSATTFAGSGPLAVNDEVFLTPVESSRDVVYLKNGSILRGTILEMIPDSTIRIQTGDGNLFVFPMRDVEKILKEESTSVPAPPMPARADRPPVSDVGDNGKVTFALFAGLGVPLGDFAKTSGGSEAGYARTGFLLGGELVTPLNGVASFLGTVTVGFNSLEIPSGPGIDVGQWVTIWPMIGIRLNAPGEDQFRLHGILQSGLLFGTYPEITITGNGTSFHEASATAVALSLSFGLGFTVINRLVIDARYLYGSPKYSLTATSGGMTASGELKQTTTLIRVTAGFILN